MSVQIKAILHRGPNEETLPRKEIRRFEIDENAKGSYDFLRAKIIALYPDLTDESPFRLMWTDDEGDNVCFSTDEELRQALKFINEDNALFKVIIKAPQVQADQHKAGLKAAAAAAQKPDETATHDTSVPPPPPMDFAETAHNLAAHAAELGSATAAHFCQAFGDANMWKPKKAEKQLKKFANMRAKQQFHEAKSRQLDEMLRQINPQMQQHIQNVASHLVGHNATVTGVKRRDDGDVDISVDIPITHANSTTTTTTSGDGHSSTTTTSSSNSANQQTTVYPNLGDSNVSAMQTEENFTTVTANDAQQAKMNDALQKMAECGFEGEWVRELLKKVDCDIARAIDELNPEK